MIGTERTVVVKVGGKEVAPGGPIERFAAAIAERERSGARIVIVHGGGEEISERAAALGLPTEKRAGQRVTDAAMLEVVVEVLAGRVNSRVVSRLEAFGVPAVGLTGLSGRLLLVRPAGRPKGSLGFVGDPVRVRPSLLEAILEEGHTPVVAPIGADRSGQLYNVNADLAAAAVARALSADLDLITDVPAVLGADRSPIASLTVPEARSLVARGIADGGMVPKLEAAERALRGSNRVWIGDFEGFVAGPGAHGTRIVATARTSVSVRRRSAGKER